MTGGNIPSYILLWTGLSIHIFDCSLFKYNQVLSPLLERHTKGRKKYLIRFHAQEHRGGQNI